IPCTPSRHPNPTLLPYTTLFRSPPRRAARRGEAWGRSLRVATTLKAQLREEITSALRSSDKVRLGALRMLSAAVTNREKEVLHELSDDEVREVAGKEVKKHAESIEAF